MEPDAAAIRAADAMTDFEMDKAVSSMVRFALFCQTRKVLIRKEDLRKAGGHSKAFSVIFNKSNSYLERVFSMKMVSVTEKKTWILISTLSDQSLLRKDSIDIVTMIILVIIFGSNHSITHDTLLSFLSDIGIDDGCFADETILITSVSAYVSLMVKQDYLHKESSPDYESPLYTWGPRAKVEVPPATLIEFITSVFDLDSISKSKMSTELSQRIQGQQFY